MLDVHVSSDYRSGLDSMNSVKCQSLSPQRNTPSLYSENEPENQTSEVFVTLRRHNQATTAFSPIHLNSPSNLVGFHF